MNKVNILSSKNYYDVSYMSALWCATNKEGVNYIISFILWFFGKLYSVASEIQRWNAINARNYSMTFMNWCKWQLFSFLPTKLNWIKKTVFSMKPLVSGFLHTVKDPSICWTVNIFCLKWCFSFWKKWGLYFFLIF